MDHAVRLPFLGWQPYFLSACDMPGSGANQNQPKPSHLGEPRETSPGLEELASQSSGTTWAQKDGWAHLDKQT